MIELSNVDLILDETYLVSTETRGFIREPEESPFQPAPPILTPPLPDSGLLSPEPPLLLPDLIPEAQRTSHSPLPSHLPGPTDPHLGREQLVVEMGRDGAMIRDLVHPALIDPLRNQQNTTFKIINLVSDFNHHLSKIHEQHADDMARLVKTFRKKTTDIQNDGPRYTSSMASAWEDWMADTMQDSAGHTEISAALGRAVARPLLEKTFHMKIQSKKVFSQRELYEKLLSENEDCLSKSHRAFRGSWTEHCDSQTDHSLATYLTAHNAYVSQVHHMNGMTEQYYEEGLPHTLQELDDVCHDVSAVVKESLCEGAKKSTEMLGNMASRWQKTAEVVQKINADKDISSFLNSITIPDCVPITKHTFAPPPPKEVTKESHLPLKTCDIVLDRVVGATVRTRHEQLREEGKNLESCVRLSSEAVESLIRIQEKNLEQKLYNKANEIQEEISKKRFDLRCKQIQLAGVRAQKELYSAKVMKEEDSPGTVEGVPAGGPCKKTISGAATEKMKSKWVNAFKNVKGAKKEPSVKPSTPVATGAPQVLSNSHQFQEYTYKKITPCDVCSQVLRGQLRQGLKCKLCRINIHQECQEQVVKCQPKSKQRVTASEFGDEQDDSGFLSPRASVEPPSLQQKFQVLRNLKSHLSESKQKLPQSTAPSPEVPENESVAAAPPRKKVGGSYSRYTGGGGLSRGLTIDGELVDSSGRRIKTENMTEDGPATSSANGGVMDGVA